MHEEISIANEKLKQVGLDYDIEFHENIFHVKETQYRNACIELFPCGNLMHPSSHVEMYLFGTY